MTELAEGLLQLARRYRALGREAEALPVLAELLRQQPAHAAGLLELTYLHRRAGRFTDALAVAEYLVGAQPDMVLGWTTLGTILHQLLRFDDAEACYRRALDLSPGFAPALTFLGYTLLLRGQWAEGLAAFEARRQLPDALPPPCGAPEWRGPGTDAPGTRLLIWNDQGFGDALQCLRFVPVLVERGYRPVLCLAVPLQRIAAGLGVPVIGPGDPVPAVDCHVTIGSLPHRLSLRDPAESWRGPYLAVPNAPPRSPGLHVGLVWAGSASHENDARRSVPLAALAPLFAWPDIIWHSLQVGPRAADITAVPFAGQIIDESLRLHDFFDTASVMAGLDLVISVDTATLHLAGALGVPAWALLGTPPDWRWQAAGETIGWYPGLRLFRQPAPGDWASVAAAVAIGLATLLSAA